MGSRARVATAACLVVSGLLGGAASTATAVAEPAGSGDGATSDSAGEASQTGADRRPQRAERQPNRNAGQGGSGSGDGDDSDDSDTSDEGLEAPEKDPGVPNGDEGDGDEDEEPGEHWWQDLCDHAGWQWPAPAPSAGDSASSSSTHGGGMPAGPPVLRPFPGLGVPAELMPPADGPVAPDVVDAVAGVGAPVVGSAGTPLSVPFVVPAPAGAPVPAGVPAGVAPVPAGSGAAPSGFGGPGAGLPGAPRLTPAEPAPARGPLPGTAGGNAAAPASTYRSGYADYLRGAGFSQVAALAVPGLAGILVLTGAGGLVGYRQAKAGRAVRTSGTGRFMN